MLKRLSLLLVFLPLAACDTVNDWFDGEKKTRIEGERIAILAEKRGLDAPETPPSPVTLPEAEGFNVWLQAYGNARHQPGAIAMKPGFSEIASATAGDGEAWEYRLVPTPVVAGNKVFALDADGVVSAHSIRDIDTVLWTAEVYDGDEELVSGGLAIARDMLIVALSDGTVAALNYPTGREIWRRTIGSPLRSAPSVDRDALYLISADNQLIAMDVTTGTILWQHRGILENASLLGTAIPAASEGTIIATYSSGEVFALTAATGKPIWNDSLILPQRTAALNAFSGIGGSPVIAGSLVYTLSQNGLAAANDIRTGIRAWERPLTSTTTPWVAGDMLYALSSTGSVVALYGKDGQVAWKADIPTGEEEILWNGPVVIGNAVFVFSSEGVAYALDAATGKPVGERDFADGAVSPPAFAQGIMFVLDASSTLHAYR